jgi:polysaccharide biosynthesis/export protein
MWLAVGGMEKTNKSPVKMEKNTLHEKNLMIYTIAAVLILGLSSFASGAADEYILKPGDVIDVNVVEHIEFSGRHKIRPDGRINYPVIGELDVASLSCAQLVKIMQGKLAPYVNNPVVSVSIEAYYANKIFIIGDVSRAGEFEIYEPIELIKAVAMCGGLKSSNPKKAKIIRGDGTVITVDMRELLSGRMSKRETEKYLLYPGDTMYVPESFSINWGLIATILGIVCVSLQIALYSSYLSHSK